MKDRKNTEELFSKLNELFYTSEFTIDGTTTVAHYIVMYYQDYGYLDGCELVKKSDRKALDKWYTKSNITEPFDWSNLPMAASGICFPTMPNFGDYRYRSYTSGCSG